MPRYRQHAVLSAELLRELRHEVVGTERGERLGNSDDALHLHQRGLRQAQRRYRLDQCSDAPARRQDHRVAWLEHVDDPVRRLDADRGERFGMRPTAGRDAHLAKIEACLQFTLEVDVARRRGDHTDLDHATAARLLQQPDDPGARHRQARGNLLLRQVVLVVKERHSLDRLLLPAQCPSPVRQLFRADQLSAQG